MLFNSLRSSFLVIRVLQVCTHERGFLTKLCFHIHVQFCSHTYFYVKQTNNVYFILNNIQFSSKKTSMYVLTYYNYTNCWPCIHRLPRPRPMHRCIVFHRYLFVANQTSPFFSANTVPPTEAELPTWHSAGRFGDSPENALATLTVKSERQQI